MSTGRDIEDRMLAEGLLLIQRLADANAKDRDEMKRALREIRELADLGMSMLGEPGWTFGRLRWRKWHNFRTRR